MVYYFDFVLSIVNLYQGFDSYVGIIGNEVVDKVNNEG